MESEQIYEGEDESAESSGQLSPDHLAGGNFPNGTNGNTEYPQSAVPPEITPEVEKQREIFEKYQTRRANFLTNFLTSQIVSNGLDLLPFAGGGKMIVESIAGKTLAGKRMDGKSRLIHGAVGAGSLALDFTGVGEAKEGVVIAGKGVVLIEKIAAMLAERGAAKAAKIFEATAQFMVSHPEITSMAEKYAEAKIREQIENIKSYPGQATA